MLPALLLIACTPDDGATDGVIADSGARDSGDSGGSVGPATLALAFAMDGDLIEDMQEAPIGVFRGSIYAEADASAIGPVEGASSLVDFVSAEVDLSADGGPSGTAWTSEPIEAQTVWILGCLDTDDTDCECGDPITIPNDNKVVLTGCPNSLTVQMEMLHPC